MKKITSVFASLALFATAANAALPESVDLLVVGGGASGVTAGIQAARMGTNTLIIEEQPWIGGMLTSAGVSATDGRFGMQR
ncbi:MAG: FAD-dependent oxidoreductase, partial [Muribaculaceae bacterium]|nr:FAD-dependent oxidoreductase [Muribaculaceae bacterium]